MKKMESEKRMSENGKEEKREIIHKKEKEKKLGGTKTLPFIFANEICDRFAGIGFYSNIITYLTKELNLPLVKASNILTGFGGTGSITLLLGALIADSFAGRFWTIVVGSIIYELGLLTVTISAVLPQFRPPPCPTQENCKEASAVHLSVLYISLLLASLGSGGIRPCVVTFAADQYDMNAPLKDFRRWNFFNLFNFCMAFSALAALTIIVYIQDHVGWGWGLGLPTIAMAVAIITFIIGSPLYKKVKPGGSPLVRLAQVIVAAVKKRNAIVPADPSLLYQNKELDAPLSSSGRLLHTNQFGWFDRAAIVTARDTNDSGPPNLWRLATVHRVEELKSILRMLPIWGAAILLVASYSHQDSFTVIQASMMDRHITKSFQISPASLAIFEILTIIVGIPLYERYFVPFARRFTGNPAGMTCLQRMGIGYAVNIISTIVSAIVEIKRKEVAAHHNLLDKPTAVVPISVFWLVPQFCIGGISDVFWSSAHFEFLYDQSPESMRSTVLALYWVAVSMGNYVGTIMVSLVHKYTGKENNWLPDRNLNRGKLDYYYWLVTGIQVVDFIYFLGCAWFFTYKPLELVTVSIKDEDVELATDKIPSRPLNGANGNEERELETIDTI